MNEWWHLNARAAAEKLGTDAENGLTTEAVAERILRFGKNQLEEKKGKTPFQLFTDQFKNFIIWVLIGAAGVSGFLQEWVDAIAIVGIVIVNAVLGFIQEFRAEKSLAALRRLSSPNSKVIRNGQLQLIASAEIVPGDLVEVEAGDYIPADCRVVYATGNFSTHEASLTGESTPVSKSADPIDKESVPLADRSNMLYMGTSVVSGKGRALVTSAGMQTELGRIAGMIQKIEDHTTPLQRKLEEFGRIIVYIAFFLVGIIFLIGFLRGEPVLDLFLSAVSLAVAAIPEGLPAVVTIALALGVQRMVKRNCLIRKLPSVETLGCTSVICSDKTGTLTRNEMTVQMIFQGGKYFEVTGIGYSPEGEFRNQGNIVNPLALGSLEQLLAGSVLCNGASLVIRDGKHAIAGDPTEGALLTMAAKAGLNKGELEKKYPFVEEIPFDSDRKKMTIIRKKDSGYIAWVKGAPDILLGNCSSIDTGAGAEPLSETQRHAVIQANGELADQAMRVLGVAYRLFDTYPASTAAAEIETNLVFSGLVAMIDPPRPEVKLAIAQCKSAGIRSVMITGDHKNTAVAIARQLGFFHNHSLAFTGEELDKLSDAELAENIERTSVYARVSPEHKLRIVKAWREKNQIVAMTGDGVNDAPAVKEADIGVAMGITGTDVTKEVSDMVITDDNFASIVAAVEEGRGIFDNIRKFIHYLLSCNVGEILVMFVASLFRLPVPLLPIQILWINLVTDGLPALALGVDPTDRKIMSRPPRPKNERVIHTQLGLLVLAQGAFIALCSLAAFWFVLVIEDEGIGRARTACFMVLACSQLFHSFNCRSQRDSIFTLGILSNTKLLGAVLISFVLQLSVVYVPFMQVIFKTEALTATDWTMVVLVSTFPLLAMEIVKLVMRIAGRRKAD